MASSKKGGGQVRPDHDDTVGYRRPPKQHRFRKGEPSRNPYGRGGKPKERDRAETSAPDFLEGLVTITIDGKPTRMTREEAIDYRLFSSALEGNVRAARELDRRRAERLRRQAVSRVEQANTSDADASTDAEIVARALARQANGYRGPQADTPRSEDGQASSPFPGGEDDHG